MLIGSTPNDSIGNAAGVSGAPSLSIIPTESTENAAGGSGLPSLPIVPSYQSPTNSAGETSCLNCGSPLKEDVGMETTRISIIMASPIASLSPAAQTYTQGLAYGSGPSTVPTGRSTTATSSPTNHEPYFTGSSEKSVRIFSQTKALGLILVVGAGLAMR